MTRQLPILPLEIIDMILIYVKSLSLAINLNRFSIIKEITSEQIDFLWAIRNGHRNLLDHFVINNKFKFSREFHNSIVNAVLLNHIPVLIYINDHLKPLSHNPHLIACAAGRGFLTLVRYLHSVGCRARKDAMGFSAANGHVKVLRWLYFNRREGCSPNAMKFACQNGHLEVVKFLVEVKGEKIRFEAVRIAIVCGRMDVVKFLLERSQFSSTKLKLLNETGHAMGINLGELFT